MSSIVQRNSKKVLSMKQLAKTNVLGVGITPTSYEEVVCLCDRWLSNRNNRRVLPGFERSSARTRYIAVTSVHGIITSVLNPSVRRCINRADVATPDGMPVVWALRSFGCKGQQRVYGPTLTLALCAMAEKRGHSIFLYGSRPETLDSLRDNLLLQYPNLRIAGSFSPPFRPLTEDESAEILQRITDSGAAFVFVGLSTPKQELWMAAHARQLDGMVLVGVGAAFDFHAGKLPQAPGWMQRSGLEWLFRLLAEPRRLWRRYLLVTPLFLPLWGLQRLGILQFWQRFALDDPRRRMVKSAGL
jgi:N-acetylglucosaminyldiphosphoundecaprenol N-acetyl-beta-D-mannosaminyltransferase